MDADDRDHSIARSLYDIGEFVGWATVVFRMALAVIRATTIWPASKYGSSFNVIG